MKQATDAGEGLVLILARAGRDGVVAAGVLAQNRIASRICYSLDELVDQLPNASAAILTIEDLAASNSRRLSEWVQGQPNWSDFPFVLLTFRHSPFDSKFVEMLVNAAVLERPFHPLSLAAAVRSALRARRRQKGAEALLLEHERVAARQKVLIRELHHRVRNMLATIQGVMSVTSRASGNVRDFTLAFSERLQSLARTHQLLTDDTFQSASLLDLLQQELQPYADSDARRFSLEGPPVDLPSILAVPFGMAVHELATNSIKYGALSAPSGRLSITWAVGGRGDDRELTFKWVETGGPEVRPPARNGFGTVLITRVLAPQSRAEVSMDYDPQGLIFEMRAPLA